MNDQSRFLLIQPALAAAALCLILTLPPMAHGEDHPGNEGYLQWDEVPMVVSNDPARFRRLLHEGFDDIRRVLILGDSQETSPGGSGSVYVPHLSYSLWNKVGYLGESPFIDCSLSGTGQPPAGWLRAVTSGPGGPGPTSIKPNQIPPGMLVRQSILPSSDGPQQSGTFISLVHDGSLTADPWIEQRDYMDPSASLISEIYAFTKPNSGDIIWKYRPTDNPVGWSSASDTGVLDVDASDTSVTVVKGRTPTLAREGRLYHRLEVHGSDAKKSVEIAGLRFIDTRRHIGVSVQSFSVGGYSSASFLNNHDQCAAMLRALDFDMVILQYGANDLGSTANIHEQRMADIIEFIRFELEDPCFPVVLVTDPWRVVPSSSPDHQDFFPGAAEKLSRELPAIMVVNIRRILQEKYGWGPDNRDHLKDFAHLEPYAQRVVARELTDALWGESEAACPADLNGDGFVDTYDINELLLAWGMHETCGHSADFNDDMYVDSKDLEWVFAQFSPCPERPSESGPSIGGFSP